MKLTFKHIIIAVSAFILLIAANVYQWQNPKVIEIPSDPVRIDPDSYVQRTIYNSQNELIEKLERENAKMAKRIKQSDDQIAAFTQINGWLNLQVDSLENAADQWHNLDRNSLISEIPDSDSSDLTNSDKSFLAKAHEDLRELQGLRASCYGCLPQIADTVLKSYKTFGSGLFLVTGYAHFRESAQSVIQFRQDFELEQMRDIRLNVVNTMNRDKTRILTYVHSPDFEDLEYKSYTEFKPKRKLPKFWLGVGVGIVGTAIILK